MVNCKKALIILLVFCTVFLLSQFVYNYISLKVLNRSVNIAYITDKNFVYPTKVSIQSAIFNKSRDAEYNIHVVCVDLSKKEEKEFQDFEGNKVHIKLYPVSMNTLKGIGEYKTENNVPRSVLFTFLLPDILNDLDKVLYLDGDTLILDDLQKLYNTNIRYSYLGVVPHYGAYERDTKSHLHYNAGVMLMNLKRMRSHKICKKLLMEKSEYKLRSVHVQGVFNKVLPLDKQKKLPLKYNFLTNIIEIEWHDVSNHLKKYYFFESDLYNFDKIKQDAVILHFAGPEKPWINRNLPFADVWEKYSSILENNKNKEVNIVLTTDKNYIFPTKVSIKSAIFNKDRNSKYNIYVLCVDSSKEQCDEFKALSTDNVNVIPKKLNTSVIPAKIKLGLRNKIHVTEADLFKFYFPEIFSNLNKILYLDSDILILGDLKNIYNTDLSKNYIAAVARYGHIGYEREDSIYYNCGVLLMNLKKMRKDGLVKKFLDEKERDTIGDVHTQRIFNKVIPIDSSIALSPVYNDIVRVVFNYQIKEHINLFEKYYSIKDLRKVDTYKKLNKEAIIIHFAGPDKPWKTKDVSFYDEWMQYAKMINENNEFDEFIKKVRYENK